eukprot:1159619-Pelagomonas_calceolata.AAC.5
MAPFSDLKQKGGGSACMTQSQCYMYMGVGRGGCGGKGAASYLEGQVWASAAQFLPHNPAATQFLIALSMQLNI